ncbi:MAG: ferrous iron transporter B, partial [Clostridia bacterium]|nr:ferrous iron transporter B [Clostridia bacterium]
LGVKVIGTTAMKRKSLEKVIDALDEFFDEKAMHSYLNIFYNETIENAIEVFENVLKNKDLKGLNPRWVCLKILENDADLTNELECYLGADFFSDIDVINAINNANRILSQKHLIGEKFKDEIVSSVIKYAEIICKNIVKKRTNKRYNFDGKIDKILTSKTFGYPIMIVGLMIILWLTISGANYPSNWLSKGLFYIQDRFSDLLLIIGSPKWLHNILVFGVFRVVAWVVSVMLPPMAIFFPLFTLLEDCGFLPRVAYNLDKPFKKCNACGKQSLTMCMGFGCNAVGVTGCRIIDSKRERILAILTNSFVPCNGRFPTLIAIISMFFIGSSIGILSSCFSSIILTFLIVLSVFMTFLATYVLSKTLLKGEPSSFTLELPSYRKPQIIKVFVRSIFDRTLFVLGRAVVVAAPAGAIIWLLANLTFNNQSLLSVIANFLNPFATHFGLDGVILLSFILGFPANEIVIPIIIMTYLSKSTLVDYESLNALKELFITNGWTITTALCFTVFSLFHWPCSTTLITIKRETKSVKWTIVSALMPTLTGLLICFIIKSISNLIT